MLTGISFKDKLLPNAFRGTENAQTVDSWPFIWKDFKAAGYKTLFIEDFLRTGTFQNRLLGFHEQPTDFYGRLLYMLREKVWKKEVTAEGMCMFGRPRYMLFLDYLLEFIRVHGHGKAFAFGLYNELTHDDNEPV